MSDAKKAILARRAKFVAAALAGFACGKEPKAEPTVCLSIAPLNADAGPEPPPQPCLSPVPPPPPDAGSEATSDGGVGSSGDAGPPPQPCLRQPAPPPDAGVAKPKPQPPPQPCLKMIPHKEGG